VAQNGGGAKRGYVETFCGWPKEMEKIAIFLFSGAIVLLCLE
jgi:hypothetical protein